MKIGQWLFPAAVLLLGCLTIWVWKSDAALNFNCWRNAGKWDAADRVCRLDARTYLQSKG